MVNKMISIFKPKKIKDFNPSGLNIYTFNAGFKKKDKDLLLIIFDKIINVCCVYSKTSTPSAPIIWDKKNNKGKVKALVVNAGNANAHTGKEGLKIIDLTGAGDLFAAGYLHGFINNLTTEECFCLLYTSPSPRDGTSSRMPSSA